MSVWGVRNGAVGLGALLALPLALTSLGASASASVLSFTFQGTVASFIDTNNVFGFGAGADLSGDSITDVYKIDTAYSVFTSGQPYGPGSAYNEFDGGFGGASQATSTIAGHTVSFTIANGDQLTAYTQQFYLGAGSPPNPYNQSLIELQAIGYETTGTAPGSIFFIRDEAVSYSLVIPLSLTSDYAFSLASLNNGASAPALAEAVFYDYSPANEIGYSNLTFGAAGVPEPGAWATMLLGLGGLGAAMRVRRRVPAFARA